MRVLNLMLLLGLSMGLSGCWMGKKKVPVPPPPAPQAATPVPAPPANVPAAPAPDPTPPAPPMAKKPVPRPALPKPVAAVPKAAAPAPAAPTPAPQLQEMLTPESRARSEAELTASIGRARAAIEKASARRLTAAQQENVNRIRTFLAQTEEARKQDLPTALQLARRADLLGQDLMKSLN